MAGSTIKLHAGVQVKDEETRALLQKLEIEGHTRPLMRQIGEYLQESIQDRFKKQIAPDGTSWQPLSPGYLKRKHRNADKILTLRGYLRRYIQYQVETAGSVSVGSNSVYAAIHNLGGAGNGKNATMPKRQFIGVSSADSQAITQIVSDWLTSRTRG